MGRSITMGAPEVSEAHQPNAVTSWPRWVSGRADCMVIEPWKDLGCPETRRPANEHSCCWTSHLWPQRIYGEHHEETERSWQNSQSQADQASAGSKGSQEVHKKQDTSVSRMQLIFVKFVKNAMSHYLLVCLFLKCLQLTFAHVLCMYLTVCFSLLVLHRRGSQHDVRETSPDSYGSLGRKQRYVHFTTSLNCVFAVDWCKTMLWVIF